MKKIFLMCLSLVFVGMSMPTTVVFAVYQPAIRADIVLAHTNVERYKEGLPLLKSNIILSQVAREKMSDLFAYQYFAHESPQGETVSDLAKRNGYAFILVGENLALGDFVSSKDVVNAWMDSPGHRKNILSESYSEIGIAVGRSMYEGRMQWVVVQSFGLPKDSCPAIDVELEGELESINEKLEIMGTIAQMREVQAQRRDGSLSDIQRRIESYNTAARMYNGYVERYKTIVDDYNESVGAFNECLKEVKERIDNV
jgi:hypothetical protein